MWVTHDGCITDPQDASGIDLLIWDDADEEGSFQKC